VSVCTSEQAYARRRLLLLKRNLFQVGVTSSELKRGPIDSVEVPETALALRSVVSTGSGL